MVYFLWNCERIYLQRLDVNALPEKDPYINPDADPTLPEDR